MESFHFQGSYRKGFSFRGCPELPFLVSQRTSGQAGDSQCLPWGATGLLPETCLGFSLPEGSSDLTLHDLIRSVSNPGEPSHCAQILGWAWAPHQAPSPAGAGTTPEYSSAWYHAYAEGIWLLPGGKGVSLAPLCPTPLPLGSLPAWLRGFQSLWGEHSADVV